MNGQGLIDLLRNEILDSPEADSLWTDATLLRNLIEAEREIAIRALCLSDSTTANVATLAAATPGWNALSVKILVIDDVVLAGKRLRFVREDLLNRLIAGHETDVTGSPAFYTLSNRRIRFVPNTKANAALAMTVKRLPLADFAENTAPEVPESYYQAMLHYAAYLSYSKQDSQTLDNNAAANHLARFEAMVGPEVGIMEQWNRFHKIETPPKEA